MIAKLRWIERDGVRVLQMASVEVGARIMDGEVVWTWQDVPLETGG